MDKQIRRRPWPGAAAGSALVLASLALGACSGSQPVTPAGQAGTSGAASAAGAQIQGAGATFPYPLYSKWFSEYNKLHPEVQINYQSIGSGGGIRQLTNETVFFGASDGPMTDEQLKAAPAPILHLPTVLGAVVPIYNVEGVAELRFSGPLLAEIYLGTVKKWNDPRIAAENPGTRLPAVDITVVHRADGSGTTYIFCDFLAKTAPAWKQRVGVATSVEWPAGVGAKGNEGVAGQVKQTPGAIGYVELIYALQNKTPYGPVRNTKGAYVKASLESVTAAAEGVPMPDDFRVSITNEGGETAYPIASFTWLLLYEQPKDKVAAARMVDFLRWALGDGQRMASTLGYAPLPQAVVQKEVATLARIKVQ